MSAVIFTLVIREEDQRIRKRKPPCGKLFRDRKKYTRKEKHKGRCRDTAAPLAFLCLRQRPSLKARISCNGVTICRYSCS